MTHPRAFHPSRPVADDRQLADGRRATGRASAALTRDGRAEAALGARDRLKVDRLDGGHDWPGIEADRLTEETVGNPIM
jgi:hypothetical protein